MLCLYYLYLCMLLCLIHILYNPLEYYIHGGSMKSKPNFEFHTSTSNMKAAFNIFVKKLSVVWFDNLIKEDVQNVLLLLACRPGGAGATGQCFRQCATTFVCHCDANFSKQFI